ncbi:hypothetical protein ACETU7_36070 [Rhodococcus sp. 3Y1]
MVIALGELRQIYEGLIALPDLTDHEAVDAVMSRLGDPGSFVRYCELEADALLPSTTTLESESGQGSTRSAVAHHRVSRLDLGVEGGKPAPQGADVRVLLDEELTATFDEICLSAGGSVFTGILTAMGLSVHSYTGRSTLPLQFPLHIRKDPRWADAIGWLTTSAPITVQILPTRISVHPLHIRTRRSELR